MARVEDRKSTPAAEGVMADHDQQFKTLLRAFFKEFIELFFPKWAERFDFTEVTWLDKEIFPDPPQGKTYDIDLLARLKVRKPVVLASGGAEHLLVLIHVEVESADKVAPLRPRMFHYYEHLRRHHDLPVLPIGLYLRVGLNGVGWDEYVEQFWEETLLRFRSAYIGLPGLNAEDYLKRNNWLSVALTALMRVSPEDRLKLAEQAWRRLVECDEVQFRRLLLFGCLGAYAPLDDEQREELDRRLRNDPDLRVQAM